jgi:DNA-binding MarR family transcriptional regulator
MANSSNDILTPTAPHKAPQNLQEELGKIHPFALPHEEVYLNLERTLDVLSSDFRQLFAEYGLSEATYNVLRIVAARGTQGIPSQSIGKDLVRRDPDVTRLIDRLVKQGFVRRERSESDRRVVQVIITDKATDLLRQIRKPISELHQKQLGHLSDKKLRKLSKLLFEARHPDHHQSDEDQ